MLSDITNLTLMILITHSLNISKNQGRRKYSIGENDWFVLCSDRNDAIMRIKNLAKSIFCYEKNYPIAG
jgi:hypothetical protein